MPKHPKVHGAGSDEGDSSAWFEANVNLVLELASGAQLTEVVLAPSCLECQLKSALHSLRILGSRQDLPASLLPEAGRAAVVTESHAECADSVARGHGGFFVADLGRLDVGVLVVVDTGRPSPCSLDLGPDALRELTFELRQNAVLMRLVLAHRYFRRRLLDQIFEITEPREEVVEVERRHRMSFENDQKWSKHEI
ncbi:hypothetical protein [Caudoviricetes sp.]|nr:hypothetical protein [Caudoviricetes sp.]